MTSKGLKNENFCEDLGISDPLMDPSGGLNMAIFSQIVKKLDIGESKQTKLLEGMGVSSYFGDTKIPKKDQVSVSKEELNRSELLKHLILALASL
jgi:hypothetical protein